MKKRNWKTAVMYLCWIFVIGISIYLIKQDLKRINELEEEERLRLLQEQHNYNQLENSIYKIEENGAVWIVAIDSIMPVCQNQIDTNMAIKIENEKRASAYFYLTDYERTVVEYIVAGEAGYESYEGKWAVAQCILNGCLRNGAQPSEVKTAYKYSGWKTNLKSESPEDWAEVQEVVSRVFDYGEMCVDDFILWFYAPKYSSGGWHNTQRFVTQIGGHRFYSTW